MSEANADTTADENTTADTTKWVPRDTCSAIAAAPMAPPKIAPADHTAWNELMIDRPYRRCTRSPCAFCATSVTASAPPAANSAAANVHTDGPTAANHANTAMPTDPDTATRAEPNRRSNDAADGPVTSAPTENAATATP